MIPKDSLVTVGFRTCGGGSRVLNQKVLNVPLEGGRGGSPVQDEVLKNTIFCPFPLFNERDRQSIKCTSQACFIPYSNESETKERFILCCLTLATLINHQNSTHVCYEGVIGFSQVPMKWTGWDLLWVWCRHRSKDCSLVQPLPYQTLGFAVQKILRFCHS